jgi:hypothetical protein
MQKFMHAKIFPLDIIFVLSAVSIKIKLKDYSFQIISNKRNDAVMITTE